MLLSLNLTAGIDKTVLVQGYGAYEYDNSYAADCARAHPDKFACVVIVDQRRHGAPERLNYWVEERGARGLRLVTTTEPETFLDDPQTFPVWQTAAALGIPICIMTRFRQVALLHTALERFPNVPVALDHLGAPRLSDILRQPATAFRPCALREFVFEVLDRDLVRRATGKKQFQGIFRPYTRPFRCQPPDVGVKLSSDS
jgi:predicted TIM-barrel fold metal-dependent hydrolase